MKLADGIGEHRGGHKLFININLDSVCGKDLCGLLGEKGGLYAAVIGNRNAFSALVKHIFGKSLGGLSDRIDVHSVGSRADNSSKSCGAEFKLAVKTVVNFVIVSFNAFKLGNKIGVVNGFFKPQRIKFGSIHKNILSL